MTPPPQGTTRGGERHGGGGDFAASWGRNPLAAAAARTLLLTPEVAGWRTEGAVLQDALAEYGLALLPLPDPGVTPVQLHSTGSLRAVPSLSPVLVVTDGGLRGSAMSGGILVWHPVMGVVYTAWYGLCVCGATPTDAEGLAKQPHPAAYFVLDASHAQHRSMTSPPPPRPQCCRRCTGTPWCGGGRVCRARFGSVRATPLAV